MNVLLVADLNEDDVLRLLKAQVVVITDATFTDDPQPFELPFACECFRVNAFDLIPLHNLIGGVLISGAQRNRAMWLHVPNSDASQIAPPRRGLSAGISHA